MTFAVKLNIYDGPLDLLLYLVRKHEMNVAEVPIAEITNQYLEHLAVLAKVDVDAVGDFLDVASLLVEIKSRTVLPGDDEVEQELEDPRHELVRRLLEFKQFRDAASVLEEQSREWRNRYPRVADDQPTVSIEPHRQPIQHIELWDLVSAFGRVMKQKFAVPGPENIRYDDTPIHVFMRRIDQYLRTRGPSAFSALFDEAAHKSTYVGMFLALLQLMRYRYVRATQPEVFDEIWLEAGEVPLPDELDDVHEHEHQAGKLSA